MKYIHYSDTGKILGFYDKSLHKTIPEPNVEVEDNEWRGLLGRVDRYEIKNEEVALKPEPSQEEKFNKAKIEKLNDLNMVKVDKARIEKLLIADIAALEVSIQSAVDETDLNNINLKGFF